MTAKNLPLTAEELDTLRDLAYLGELAAAEIKRLRAALAAQPAEPVAEVHPNHLRPHDETGGHWCREVLLYSGNSPHDWLDGKNTRVKLYAASAAVPLTDEQIASIRGAQGTGVHWRLYVEIVRHVERAHGIAAAGDKNNAAT